MKIFDIYAEYYNLLYADKNYEEEVNYIDSLIKCYLKNDLIKKGLLDIGCGTGKHANLFAKKSYCVTGIDFSEKMISEAKKLENETLKFYVKDGKSFNLDLKFDVITSLFHVVSYQNTNEDIIKYFKNVFNHLNYDGIFIFDFWYGPAVLTDKPAIKVKKCENKNIQLTRIAEPAIIYNRNLVEINYEILIQNKLDNSLFKLNEKHVMRYFFMPELEVLLNNNGMKITGSFEWMTLKEPDLNSWYVVIIANKIKEKVNQ